MEDLFGVLIFLVIIAVNIGRFLLERRKEKSATETPTGKIARPAPTPAPGLVKLLEQLAERASQQPKPASSASTTYPPPPTRARIIPVQPKEQPEPEMGMEMGLEMELGLEPESTFIPENMDLYREEEAFNIESTDFLSLLETEQPALTISPSAPVSSTNPFGRSAAPGPATLNLQGPGKLRQAILAYAVFSAPRAYNDSFENPIVQQGH